MVFSVEVGGWELEVMVVVEGEIVTGSVARKREGVIRMRVGSSARRRRNEEDGWVSLV